MGAGGKECNQEEGEGGGEGERVERVWEGGEGGGREEKKKMGKAGGGGEGR